MNCRKVNHLLSAYMDGELPGVEHRQIHEHIAQCVECYQEYEALLRMKRLLACMRLRAPQADMSERIVRQLHQAEMNTQEPTRGWLDLIFVRGRALLPLRALAAGVALLVVCVIAVERNTPTTPQARWQPSEDALLEAAPDNVLAMRLGEPASGAMPIMRVGYGAPSLSYGALHFGPSIDPRHGLEGFPYPFH